MHFPPARHIEGVGALLRHMEGHILQKLPHEPVPEVPGGNILALPPGKGTVVDGEGHFNGGVGDFDKGQGLHCVRGADSPADGNIRHAGESHNFPGGGLLNGVFAQPIKLIQSYDFALLPDVRVVIVANGDLLAHLHCAALNAANADTAHILIVVDGRYQHLQGRSGVAGGGGDVVDNGFKQRCEVGAHLIGTIGGNALPGRAENGGGVELLVGGVQIQEQLQDFIHDLMDPGVGTVHLVDHHDDLVSQLQGLLEDEPGLGHGAFCGVHQQKDAVDHFQDPLYLTTEVGMARRIHNINFGVFIMNGRVFGQDGDATLPLQISGVHDPLHGGLVFPVDAALLQHLVHQGGLAVVHVGDDCDVTNVLLLRHKKVAPSMI